jgi:hypothetical protein
MDNNAAASSERLDYGVYRRSDETHLTLRLMGRPAAYQVFKMLRKDLRQRCGILVTGMQGDNIGETAIVNCRPRPSRPGKSHSRKRGWCSQHPVQIAGNAKTDNCGPLVRWNEHAAPPDV